MHSKTKVVRHGEEVTLISQNGGRAMAWLLLVEIVLLGGLMSGLGIVLADADQLVLPAAASLALMLWTAVQIKPDHRITFDLAARRGRVVRIAAITSARTSVSFALDEVESMELRQTVSRAFWKEYVVAVELRDGGRHVLSARGPLMAYQDNVARFSGAAGVGNRVVRLPA